MSKEQDTSIFMGAVYAVGSLIMLTFAVLFCLLIIKVSLGAYSGVRNWAHSITTTSPEEQAAIKQADEEWANDPTNPAVVGQKCLDRGGTPIYSAWDGRVKSCQGNDGKSVKIEVNQ
jgi:hypothetical protein